MSSYFQTARNNLVLDSATMVTCLNILMNLNTKIFNVALVSLNGLNANTTGVLQKSLTSKEIGRLLKLVKDFQGEYYFNRSS